MQDPIFVVTQKVGDRFVAWPGDLPPVTAASRAGAMAAARRALIDAGQEGRRLEFGIADPA